MLFSRPPHLHPGNITNNITTLQPLPSGQHFMNPPSKEQIYHSRYSDCDIPFFPEVYPWILSCSYNHHILIIPPYSINVIFLRSKLFTLRIDLNLPKTNEKYEKRKRNWKKTSQTKRQSKTENAGPSRPPFITCAHPVTKCLCVQRSRSPEKLKPRKSLLSRRKSVNFIRSGSQSGPITTAKDEKVSQVLLPDVALKIGTRFCFKNCC